ncbi:metallophosphoesterase family protein [Frigoriflavimonas asaccharolytica]|uniref:Putative phosphodiesterase n=1 Tax=Frigoriflavimonas asaccharolytica TaxID=2735899 RepID=A0A8J8GC07_9FLAO|nr:metallophosphoesterase family protein [Frigoriflavimonas asaccharolytica]NRS92932.1 putative phosphodiesterase [Frigoriflavimonas asaccharolytica]
MDKKLENLGKIEGKILLFGGVYSNLQALEALKTVAEEENILPEHCICTGDIVGYCAQPEESIQFFKNWKAKAIRGNVEEQLIENAEDCGCDFTEGSRCDILSQFWYPYAKSKLSENSINYLKTIANHLTFEIAGKKASVVHGAYSNISEFIFKSTHWSKKEENFEQTESQIIIAGHCGLPFLDVKDHKFWINPGVIGMPANDGKTDVWYAIMQEKDNTLDIEFKNLKYDFKLANKLMIENNLPSEYAKTLVTGIWNNMEILPNEEKNLQGKEIVFDAIKISKK